MRKHHLVGASMVAMAAASVGQGASSDSAPMMQYLGYTTLLGSSLNAPLADGSNVPVAIAETTPTGQNVYYPDTTAGQFAAKTMTPSSTFTQALGSSAHATGVGTRFFGNTTGYSSRSVAPNIQNIQMYSYSEFNGSYLLNSSNSTDDTLPVLGSPNNARVASHAYVTSDSSPLNYLERLDYLVQRDDFIQVVGNNVYGVAGNSLNSIVVVSADGTSQKTATYGTGTPYTAGRSSPVITGPLNGSPSDAIGQVSGVVALLVSRGKTTNSNVTYTTAATSAVTAPYSGGDFASTIHPKDGYLVHSGDTSEVVKAALMAGANRLAAANGTINNPGISSYVVDTTNGLDSHYGAGMVNALNSYKIEDAGETDSKEDSSSAGIKGGIGQYGFDYDQAFGGARDANNNLTNSTATYGFTAGGSGKFYATLAWNVKITGGTTSFDGTPTLYDLDLTLKDLTTGTVTALSASTVDNTENLYTDLIAGDKYALMVSTKSSPFNWDYGLAWRSDVALAPAAVPEPAMLGVAGVAAAMLLRRRRTM